jgi:transcriptional regulator with XRE-family HTH domain
MKTDNKILINFGLRIKEIRKNKALSQEELAHKSNLHRTYIGMIERAEKNITLINIEKLSKALDTPLNKLMENL